MDVTVAGAQGLPEKAYLSLRAGDVRKQTQYRPGECFSFDGKQPPRQLVVDVFEKVGSAQVSVSDLAAQGGSNLVQLQGRDGSIVLDMQAKVHGDAEVRKPRVSRHQAAMDAQAYLEAHSVQHVLQGMVHELLTSRPSDPFSFMMGYIQASGSSGDSPPAMQEQRQQRPFEDDDVEEMLPDWSMMAGKGDAEYPGFPSDASQPLPDLSTHFNVLAKVLMEQPELYERLKDLRSKYGTTVAQCVKPGIDHKGHKIIRTLGLMAADESCYTIFQPLFRAVMDQWHDIILQDVALSKPSEAEARLPVDPEGKVVMSVQVLCSRNLRGVRMPPSAEKEDRSDAERLLVNALMSVQDDLLQGGDYHPLRGSHSYAPKPRGMSLETEQELKVAGHLLQEPQSGLHLSGGLGRHWPQARGVFTNGKGLVAWINQADHLRLAYQREDAAVWQALESTLRVEQGLNNYLKARGYQFSFTDAVGYVTFCPANVGSAVQASARLLLPRLAMEEAKLKAMCRQLGLYPSRRRELSDTGERKPVWEVTVAKHMEMSPEDIAAALAYGCRKLVDEELRESDEGAFTEVATTVAEPMAAEAAAQALTEFPRDVCPEQMPDVNERHSLAAEVFRQDSSIYSRLKDLRTPLDVPFASCVKTCFDHWGYRMIKSVGAVAGDEASYDTFAELFDGIVRLRHPGSDGGHRSDVDFSKMLEIPKDIAGGRVAFARCRVSRNLRATRFLPGVRSAEERRAVESQVVQLLSSMDILQGEYLPLHGSDSYPARPGGMSEAEEARLHEAGLLFEEPDAPVLVSSGYALDWPDARGVFVDHDQSIALYINELDHVRVNAVDKSSASRPKAMFERVFRVLNAMEAGLDSLGSGFAQNPRLGYLGSDPALLGSCMIASVAIQIPLLSMKPEFRTLCQQLKLQAQVFPCQEFGVQPGVWEVQNSIRLGSTEVEQVNAVIEACCALLDLEARLERGHSDDLTQTMNLDLGVPKGAPAAPVGGVPGTGEEEYPGFPADLCPAEMPDLSRHNNVMAEILMNDPSIYQQLKELRTPLGVSFARCIKPGVDTAGHSFFKMLGASAGDEHCYDLFGRLFEPIIARRQQQPPNLALAGPVEAENVVSVQVSLERNLSTLHFTPAMSLEERWKVEEILCSALAELPEDFAGEYFRLRGNQQSSGSRLPELTEAQEAELSAEKWLFEAPDAPWILSTGRARHWPKARGVFLSKSKELAAWINDENHLRLIVRRAADLKAAVELLYRAEEALSSSLAKQGHHFARSERLGFLTSCPSDLGAAFRAKLRSALPLLGSEIGFSKVTRALGVQAKRVLHSEGHWDVSLSSSLVLDPSEHCSAQVNLLLFAIHELSDMERRLSCGEQLDLASEAERFQAR